MAENKVPGRPLYFELKFQECEHTATIPLGHGADCKKHCFVCMPELREKRYPGKCPVCKERD